MIILLLNHQWKIVVSQNINYLVLISIILLVYSFSKYSSLNPLYLYLKSWFHFYSSVTGASLIVSFSTRNRLVYPIFKSCNFHKIKNSKKNNYFNLLFKVNFPMIGPDRHYYFFSYQKFINYLGKIPVKPNALYY